MQRLWVKFTLAFTLVAVLAVALVAILANHVTTAGFRHFLTEEDTDEVTQLEQMLEAHYARTGSWLDVEAALESSGGIHGAGRGGGRALSVVDSAGAVVFANGPARTRLPSETTYVVPLEVAGQTVGTLLISPSGRGQQAGEQYLGLVNRSLWLAAAGAAVLALLAGVVLSQRLTRPLRQLSQATQTVAAGGVPAPVTVGARDEIGELAHHFNQMAAALDSAEKQRQQLLADTAHDLRTPISIMQSHLEAMLDGVFPATPDNLAVVHEETLQLSRLVDDIRTLSLVEAGQLPLSVEPLDLCEMVRQSAAAFRPLADADGIALTVDLPAQPCWVAGDRGRLHQVLGNLLSNALRHAPQGTSDRPEVCICGTVGEATVALRVGDNGPGLSAEQLALVFDRFWRSDKARNRQNGGSGLGLAIARGIVEAHGGTIAVTSGPLAGATFTVTLPRTDPQAVHTLHTGSSQRLHSHGV